MNIGLTDEQQMLHDTVSRLADHLATTDPSDIPAAGDVLDEHWRQVVELGVPTLRSPDLCGLAASGVETAIVVEQFARALCAVPVLGQAILATELLDAAEADKELSPVAEGSLRLAPALLHDLAGFGTTAAPPVAFDAAGATGVLLITNSGDRRQLVCVPLSGDGAGLDLTRQVRALAGDINGVATPLGEPINPQRWQQVETLALVGAAADLVGVMQGALDDAVRYAGERTQFGVKIGTFQAIQHLLADALIRVEGARSCLWHAAWAVDHLPSDAARLAALTAKAYAADAGREVVETSVQVFGGIAITWEHIAHLRMRRMLLDRRLFGDEWTHYETIAAMRLADEELA